LAATVVAHQKDVLETHVHQALDVALLDSLEYFRRNLDRTRVWGAWDIIFGEGLPVSGIETARGTHSEWNCRRDQRLADPFCGFDGPLLRQNGMDSEDGMGSAYLGATVGTNTEVRPFLSLSVISEDVSKFNSTTPLTFIPSTPCPTATLLAMSFRIELLGAAAFRECAALR